MEYEVVCGIETHIELATNTKIFCGCITAFGGEPNTHCCPVCTGQPGALPVLNRKVVEYAIRAGLAVHCSINQNSHMDRKNYYYPDLPKAYQISQNDMPLCINGYIELDSGKRIRIAHIHIEEDAGKLIHEKEYTYIDYNRAGVPLIEIVSEPDISSPEEAKEYAEKLQLIMRYVGISDCKMQEGSMRCDVNLSLREKGSERWGIRTETKNMNSLNFIYRAMQCEIERQRDILESGGRIIQQTMRYDDAKNTIAPMREKENSDDYRYFPDPDILPFCISDEELLRLKESVPELPFEKLERYVREWNVPEATARLLYRYRKICDFFEEAVAKGASARNSANLITGTIFATFASEEEKEDFYIPTTASQFAELVCLLDKKQISFQVAQDVLKKMLKSGSAVREFVSDDNPAGIADEELKTLCEAAIAANAKAAADIQAGRLKAMNALKGFVMKQTKGRADATKVERMICELLKQ